MTSCKANYCKVDHVHKYLKICEIPKGIQIWKCSICCVRYKTSRRWRRWKVYPRCLDCYKHRYNPIVILWKKYIAQFISTQSRDKCEGTVLYECAVCEESVESPIDLDIMFCSDCCNTFSKKYGLNGLSLYTEWNSGNYPV